MADGTDREARRSMMMGALMAGISFHKGLGVVHSLSHALGAEAGRTTALSTPSSCPTLSDSTASRPRTDWPTWPPRWAWAGPAMAPVTSSC